MRFFNFFSSSLKIITVKHIEDFYQYSEISRWKGTNKRKTIKFGSIISVEYYSGIYHGIYLSGGGKSGYISIENGEVQYRYTNQTYIHVVSESSPIYNKKTISLLTKIFFKWYDEMNLPTSIETIQTKKQKTFTVVSEMVVSGFDDEFQPVIRVFDDKTTWLIFGRFPPPTKKMSLKQADNLDKLLAKLTGKKVIRDDREVFVIFDDSQEMIDKVISFLQNL